MATVAQLLRVLEVAVATSQTHHERLGVVEGGGLVIQAVGADGGFHHVELLQLVLTTETSVRAADRSQICTTKYGHLGQTVNVPVATEHWPEWTGAAGRRSLRTRCPVWSYAATRNRSSLIIKLQVKNS